MPLFTKAEDLLSEKPENQDTIAQELEVDESVDPNIVIELNEKNGIMESSFDEIEVQLDTKVLESSSSGVKSADPSQFSVVRLLGQGSFGKVYMVRKDTKPKMGQYFAMKILKKASLKVRDRLRSKMERDILAEIRHPFIVGLHFAFQTEGKLFLVLDLVRGGDLFTRLSKEVMFTENDVTFYLSEIAMALDHLHKCGIVYRDLKPENILLEVDGHIKLTDFGLCKESVNQCDRTYSFCGTVEYMAPEVIARKGHGPAADWWSFAVLMYEMLSGSLPFHAHSRRETMSLILRARLAMPSYFSPNAQKLLRLLFKRIPENRLGYEKGLTEIMTQPFFSSIDFKKLFKKQVEPPFRPKVAPIEDIMDGNRELKHVGELSPTIVSAGTKLFKGFSFVAPVVDIELKGSSKDPKMTAADSLGFLPVRTSLIAQDYEIFEIIGEGSYSVVNRAVNKANNQTYAVKVVKKSSRDCSEEIDILLRFSEHPNILTLRDVYADSEKYYMVMEYCRGGELLTRINKQKSFSERETAALLDVLARTVAYLHGNGIVHRDLQPSNIMFADDSGRPDSIRIGDFGFAKQIRADNGLLMTPCFTANFVAPEVLKRQGYAESCDIYSLGIVVYAMLSGSTPYMNNCDENPDVILARISQEEINLQTGIWEKVSQSAKELIKSMTDIDPYHRIKAEEILKHEWILNMSSLPNVRLQQDVWKLKDAMKNMFTALHKKSEVKTLSSISNSTLMQRRANEKANKGEKK